MVRHDAAHAVMGLGLVMRTQHARTCSTEDLPVVLPSTDNFRCAAACVLAASPLSAPRAACVQAEW